MRIEDIPVAGYRRVARAEDPQSGLKAFIAVHDITLGPAAGGIRMWPYGTEAEAMEDVLRLAEAMSYKSALAETGLGGGKSVIQGRSPQDKSESLFRAMGRFVEALGGLYYAAEDVGISPADLLVVARETGWVTGLPREQGGSGNPSELTALGTFVGIQACLEEVFGSPELRGRTLAIQGLGSVGAALAIRAAAAGARLMVTDIRPERVAEVVRQTGARATEPDRIYDVPADVLAPCALGGVINDHTLPRLRCAIVAGAANNQLLHPRHGQALKARGIVYAPDFVINAGGIINIGAEFLPGGYDESWAQAKAEGIYGTVKMVLAAARRENRNPADVAVDLAKKRIAAGPHRKGAGPTA